MALVILKKPMIREPYIDYHDKRIVDTATLRRDEQEHTEAHSAMVQAEVHEEIERLARSALRNRKLGHLAWAQEVFFSKLGLYDRETIPEHPTRGQGRKITT